MPHLFDMPQDQLRTYQGRNPRPEDFDAFWEKALAEMHQIDSQVELIPAEFQVPFAECFHLYYTGVGGSRVHAQYLRPLHAPEPHPAVVLFHGYSGHAGDWATKLGYVANGFSVAALDCRGQGGRSQDRGQVDGTTFRGHFVRGLEGPPESMLFRQIFLDTAQLARILMSFSEVDADRVAASGASQGGALALACAALEPSIRKVACAYPFLSDYQRVWEMDLAKDAFEELRLYFRHFDPRHEREREIFTRLGYIDIQFLCPRIKADVLMITGLMDTICPPSAQFAAYNKISANKQVVIYPDFGHEVIPQQADIFYQFLATL